jgi:GT2 family glycosyltransferase
MDEVLIGIPTLNGPERLNRVLISIHKYTDLTNVKILVADDGSTVENVEINKGVVRPYDDVEILFSGRTGIAASWNRLVKHHKAPIVVLVNDDIEVVPDWLDVIRFSLTNNKQIGMIGLNTYPGKTEGQMFAENIMPLHLDYIEAKLLTGSGMLLSSQGPIFAFRREVYDEVGGFDERYFCFYEELDFGVAMRTKGYVHCMASYPVCYHMGGATNSDPINLDASHYIVESRNKFHKKWGKSLTQLRNELKHDDKIKLCEWNTQIRNWK